MKPQIHAGTFLKERYLDPLNLTITDLAKDLGVNTATLSRLINGKSDISYEMAIKLENRFGYPAESWMELQAKHNLQKLRAGKP